MIKLTIALFNLIATIEESGKAPWDPILKDSVVFWKKEVAALTSMN